MFIFSFLLHFVVSLAQGASPQVYYKNTVVEWTGYKYSEKAPVKGQLKILQIKVDGQPQTLEQLLPLTRFEVDSLSVDSGNVARDQNLREYFFKLMKTPKILGKILSYSKGEAQVELVLNGVVQKVPFKITQNKQSLSASAEIDVLDFAMGPSLKKINEICFDLHKGKDGVSKTWSHVSLLITADVVFSQQNTK